MKHIEVTSSTSSVISVDRYGKFGSRVPDVASYVFHDWYILKSTGWNVLERRWLILFSKIYVGRSAIMLSCELFSSNIWIHYNKSNNDNINIQQIRSGRKQQQQQQQQTS